MSPRSAVNIARIQPATTPDNRHVINTGANIGRSIAMGLARRKANKKAGELEAESEQLSGGILGGRNDANGMEPEPQFTPEQRQGQLQEEQINLAEEQMVNSTVQQAQAKREEVQKQNTWRDLTNDPELAENMLRLQKIDPEAAKTVANVLVSRDANQIKAMQDQSLEANRFASVFAQASLDPKVLDSDMKKMLKKRATRMQELGLPIDSLVPLMDMSRDQIVSAMRTDMAMSQAAYNAAEGAKPIVLADGAQLRGADGTLLAENEKRQSPGDQASLRSRQRGNDLRESEQKFNQNKLTNVFERELIKSQDAAQESEVQVSQLESVAQEYENLAGELGSGRTANVKESLKTFFGDEDAATNLRKRYNQIVNKKALDNLPPGAASEKDVEIVFKGFLKDSANPVKIASFLRGLAKVEAANAKFQSFKAQYISDNRNTRGFQKAWKEELASQSDDTADDSALFSKYGIN